jgi:chromosome segregation ATPase
MLLAGLTGSSPALADQTNEDRLRDALRQAVTEMRAAQDQAAQAQADLQRAQQDRATLQAQLDAASAKLAQAASAPTEKPGELADLRRQMQAGQAQNAQLQQNLAHYQTAYQGVASQMHAKDQEAQGALLGLKKDDAALNTCKSMNSRLVAVSEGILNLYQTISFRDLLLRSYEPLIGSAKVKLENLVQDYDDKIRDEEYGEPATRHQP